jgi:hypothetical protein
LSDRATTIDQRIRLLARETGAPSAFQEQVRTLFRSKGISLEEDCEPYASALREAFQREARIRRSTVDARRNLGRLQDHFRSIGTTYRRQLDQLRRIQKALERRAEALEAAGDRSSSRPGEPRRYVTRVQKDDPFLVPGPDDVQ